MARAMSTTPHPEFRDPVWWGLNEEQTRPFACREHSAVIACPGSGKTRLMIAKMLALIEEHGIEQVMAVTFTRASAQEMRSRLAKHLGTTLGKKALVGTFHAFAYQQLRGDDRKKKFHFLKPLEEEEIILRSRDRLHIYLDDEKAIHAVHLLKRSLTYPSLESMDSEQAMSWELYQDYRKTLVGMNALDTDSMIAEVVRRYNDHSGELWAPYPVQNLLVDEYQDSDMAQVEWVIAHARQGTKITVVGDDDQSIYGFRNALGISAYRKLAESLSEKNVKLFRLQTNYRCAKSIVANAGDVISNNQNRVPKKFVAYQEEDGVVEKRIFADRLDESEAVCNAFLEQQEEMAVLSRTKAWLASVELIAKSKGIDVSSVETGSFLEQKHVQRGLAAIRFGVENQNRVTLIEAMSGLGVPKKGIQKLEEKLRDLSTNESVMDRIYERRFFDDFDLDSATLIKEARKILGDWCFTCEEYGAWEKDDNEEMQNGIGYLVEKLLDHSKNNERREDLAILGNVIASRLRGSIKDRVDALINKSEKKSGPGLQLMTMHGSKGLEFPFVWIVGCSEGHVPKLDETGNLEEERRLFYVAMTRAKKRLVVSGINDPRTTKRGSLKPSRFLKEFLAEQEDEGQDDGGSEERDAPNALESEAVEA